MSVALAADDETKRDLDSMGDRKEVLMRRATFSKLAVGFATSLYFGCPSPRSRDSVGAHAAASHDSAPSISASPVAFGDATTNEPDQARTNQVNELIENILRIIDEALSKGFRPIARELLPSRALVGVDPWRSEILRQVGGKESALAYSLHLSNYPIGDVVRIEHKQAGPAVVEYHTLLAMSVWVRPEPGALAPAGVTIEDYNRIARSLFNVASAFQPRPAAPFEQGLAVSTAPMRDIYGMPSWSDRIDAGFRKGHLHFVFYHRNSTQSAGLGGGGPWFDDEFRRKNR